MLLRSTSAEDNVCRNGRREKTAGRVEQLCSLVRLAYLSVLCHGLLLWPCTAIAQESTLVLKNGMTIGPGLQGQTSKVDENAFTSIQTEQISARPIVYINDGLRVTFVNQNLIQTFADRATPLQKIETGNVGLRATGDHLRVQGVKGAVAVTPFDPFGRRVYSLLTPKGQIDVLQGITELSAAYVRVDGLNADKTYVWDMRLALSAVPPDRLREILINHANPADAQSWLNIVALYSDAKRYIEAREFLIESIRRFPELENQRPKVKQFEQLHAKHMLDEVRLRVKSGQPKLAESLLRGFPIDHLALETKLEVERRLAEIVETQSKVASTKATIQRDAAAHNRVEDKIRIDLIVADIEAKLSVHNLSRFSDYLRLRDDATLKPEQRVAMFIANWIFGSGESETNLPVMLSAWEARDLVRLYLTTDSSAERDSILDRLKAMEGGSPRWVAKMIPKLPPPRALPEFDPKSPAATRSKSPTLSTLLEVRLGTHFSFLRSTIRTDCIPV